MADPSAPTLVAQMHVPVGTFKATADVPSVQQFISPDFPNYNTGIPDCTGWTSS